MKKSRRRSCWGNQDVWQMPTVHAWLVLCWCQSVHPSPWQPSNPGRQDLDNQQKISNLSGCVFAHCQEADKGEQRLQHLQVQLQYKDTTHRLYLWIHTAHVTTNLQCRERRDRVSVTELPSSVVFRQSESLTDVTVTGRWSITELMRKHQALCT